MELKIHIKTILFAVRTERWQFRKNINCFYSQFNTFTPNMDSEFFITKEKLMNSLPSDIFTRHSIILKMR